MKRLSINLLIALSVILTNISCLNSDKFETDASGLKYVYLEQSGNIETINTGDYVEMELKYWNDADSLLFDSRELSSPFRMQVKPVSHSGGSFENAMLLLQPDDKIKFTLAADSFYIKTLKRNLPNGVKRGSRLTFELKLLKKLNNEDLVRERDSFMQQLKSKEKEFIDEYIQSNDIKAKPSPSGLYMIVIQQGNGRKAKPGNILTVHYTGKFIDGTVFDSSYKRNEVFEFELGALQVIEGWEEAFRQMKEGDKYKIIVPSSLAYGQEGYGDLIPPYCPLIFEIELIAVN